LSNKNGSKRLTPILSFDYSAISYVFEFLIVCVEYTFTGDEGSFLIKSLEREELEI
jgi:hypothetical protein